MRRGIFARCPNCGEGRLFTSYLKVAPICPSCTHALAQYRADDGPAYFTILIVGLSLALLLRVKGAFVGVQWAVGDRSQH